MPDAEFRTMIIRMVKDLKGRMHDLGENLNKDIVSTEKDIETMKRPSQK